MVLVSLIVLLDVFCRVGRGVLCTVWFLRARAWENEAAQVLALYNIFFYRNLQWKDACSSLKCRFASEARETFSPLAQFNVQDDGKSILVLARCLNMCDLQ